VKQEESEQDEVDEIKEADFTGKVTHTENSSCTFVMRNADG